MMELRRPIGLAHTLELRDILIEMLNRAGKYRKMRRTGARREIFCTIELHCKLHCTLHRMRHKMKHTFDLCHNMAETPLYS